MNFDELEDRLRAVRPPEPPWELVLRLRAAGPVAPPTHGLRQRLAGVFGHPRHPWRVAYAGVLAAWVLIVVFHLLTLPLLPASTGHPSLAQASQTAASTGIYPLEPTFLLTRNNSLDPAW